MDRVFRQLKALSAPPPSQRLATASFTVYGATPQRDSAVIGFSASTDVAAATRLYLRYDGDSVRARTTTPSRGHAPELVT